MELFWKQATFFQRELGFKGLQDEVAIVATNQAFSTLFLAASLVFGGMWLCRRNRDGQVVLYFLLTWFLIEGIVGCVSVPESKLSFLILQSGLASFAIVCLWITEKEATTDSAEKV